LYKVSSLYGQPSQRRSEHKILWQTDWRTDGLTERQKVQKQYVSPRMGGDIIRNYWKSMSHLTFQKKFQWLTWLRNETIFWCHFVHDRFYLIRPDALEFPKDCLVYFKFSILEVLARDEPTLFLHFWDYLPFEADLFELSRNNHYMYLSKPGSIFIECRWWLHLIS
jgi:hypothetical protein